jgi:hypothetical protein
VAREQGAECTARGVSSFTIADVIGDCGFLP